MITINIWQIGNDITIDIRDHSDNKLICAILSFMVLSWNKIYKDFKIISKNGKWKITGDETLLNIVDYLVFFKEKFDKETDLYFN